MDEKGGTEHLLLSAPDDLDLRQLTSDRKLFSSNKTLKQTNLRLFLLECFLKQIKSRLS
jgi:hypothetical protein